MLKAGRTLDGAALRNTSRIRQAGLRAVDAYRARLPMLGTVAVERGSDPGITVDYRCGGSAGFAL